MSITVSIKDLEGHILSIRVSGSDTIENGKRKYCTSKNRSFNDYQWKFNAKVLKNDKTFDFYEIEDGDMIGSNDKSEGGNNY